MKKALITVLVSIMLLTAAWPVIASSYDDAVYRTTVSISNTGTAASNVIVPFTLDTEDMIDGGMLSDNASDCAMVSGTGADVAVMPGYDGNPWMTFVDSIGASETQSQYLYSVNTTGGKICYFPDTAGMTISDNETLEIGDNGSIRWSGYVDTTANTTLFEKEGAISCTTDTGGNVSVTVPFSETVLSYTDDDGDGAYYYGANWGGQTFTMPSTQTVTAVKLKLLRLNSPGTITIAIRATSAGVPTGANIASGTTNGNTLTTISPGEWREITLSSPVNLSAGTTYALIFYASTGDAGNVFQARWNSAGAYAGGQRVSSTSSGSSWAASSTIDHVFEIISEGGLIATASVIPGEHDIEVLLDGTDMALLVDDVEVDSAALSGVSIPDNDNPWVVAADGVRYMECFEIDVDGTPVDRWVWEYGSTFTGSISGFVATPSFRTTSSDADVSASVSSQDSLITSTQPSAADLGGTNLIPEDIDTPDGLFTEGGTNFPGGDQLEAAADDARLPVEVYLIFIAYGTALIAGFAVMAATRNTRVGSNGSLSLMSVTCLLVMIVWVFGGDGVIPGWTLIPFGLISIILLMFRNPFSPAN